MQNLQNMRNESMQSMPGSLVPLAIFFSLMRMVFYPNLKRSSVHKLTNFSAVIEVHSWEQFQFYKDFFEVSNAHSCSSKMSAPKRAANPTARKKLINLIKPIINISLYAKNSNWLRLPLIRLIGCASVEASCPHFQQYWAGSWDRDTVRRVHFGV